MHLDRDDPSSFSLSLLVSLIVHIGGGYLLAHQGLGLLHSDKQSNSTAAARLRELERKAAERRQEEAERKTTKLTLGIAESTHKTATWLGFADPTPHEAVQGTIDQAQFSKSPGVPSEAMVAAAESPSTQPADAAPSSASAASPLPPSDAKAAPADEAEKLAAATPATNRSSNPEPSTSDSQADATPESSNESTTPQPDAPPLQLPPDPAPAPATPTPTPLDTAKVPDPKADQPPQEPPQDTPPTPLAVPPDVPPLPERPAATPPTPLSAEQLGPPISSLVQPVEPGVPVPVVEGADTPSPSTSDQIGPPIPGVPKVPLSPDSADGSLRPSPATPPPPQSDRQKAPSAAPGTAAPPKSGSGASPSVAKPRATAGGRPLPPGSRPGEKANKVSDAVALKGAIKVSPGRPAAGQGLEIDTVRPEWGKTVQMLAVPRNPVVAVTFKKDGTVKEAEFWRGMSTGWDAVDEPLLNAIFAWTAKGKKLDDLPPDDENGLTVLFDITLRGI